MANVRKQIIDDVIQALQGINGTGEYVSTVRNVYWWLAIPNTMPEYPTLVVADVEEKITDLVYDLSDRNLTVRIAATLLYPENTNSLEGVNELSGDIEKALTADITRGGLAVDTRITGTRTEIVDPEATLVAIEVECLIRYRTLRTDPDEAR